MFPRCSKMFLTVLNRLPRLLYLCQRADPVIVFRNVRIVNGAIVLRHWKKTGACYLLLWCGILVKNGRFVNRPYKRTGGLRYGPAQTKTNPPAGLRLQLFRRVFRHHLHPRTEAHPRVYCRRGGACANTHKRVLIEK